MHLQSSGKFFTTHFLCNAVQVVDSKSLRGWFLLEPVPRYRRYLLCFTRRIAKTSLDVHDTPN